MRRIAGTALGVLLISLAAWTRGAEEKQLDAIPAVSASGFEIPQVLAGQVHSIFEAYCVECHGADLARPKGKFGYILDLARVAANPKMIVPGKPAQSELYEVLVHDEMPGKGARAGPLTPPEKDVVRRWIEAGAPADLPPEITGGVGMTSSTKTAARRLTFGQRLIRWFGLFHPPFSHFPIALLIVALPAELTWMLTREAGWKTTVRFCIALGAASAVVTATLGWCAGAFSNYTGASASLLAWHRWLGTATAAWAVLTAVLSEMAHRAGYPRSLRYCFRLTLFIGTVLVSVAGHLGASLIYGLDHFRW